MTLKVPILRYPANKQTIHDNVNGSIDFIVVLFLLNHRKQASCAKALKIFNWNVHIDN